MTKENLKHILNYDILQEYGFIWATKKIYNRDQVVTSYIKDKSIESTAHNFQSILLSIHQHHTVNFIWVISYLEESGDDLFRGRIDNDESLKVILDSCLFFKP